MKEIVDQIEITKKRLSVAYFMMVNRKLNQLNLAIFNYNEKFWAIILLIMTLCLMMNPAIFGYVSAFGKYNLFIRVACITVMTVESFGFWLLLYSASKINAQRRLIYQNLYRLIFKMSASRLRMSIRRKIVVRLHCFETLSTLTLCPTPST